MSGLGRRSWADWDRRSTYQDARCRTQPTCRTARCRCDPRYCRPTRLDRSQLHPDRRTHSASVLPGNSPSRWWCFQLNPTRCSVNVSVLVDILIEIKGTVPIRVELVEAGIPDFHIEGFDIRQQEILRLAGSNGGIGWIPNRFDTGSKIGGELIRLVIVVGQSRSQWVAAITGPTPLPELCLDMFRATKEESRRAEFKGLSRELTIELKAISCSGSGGVISVEASKAKYWDEGLW